MHQSQGSVCFPLWNTKKKSAHSSIIVNPPLISTMKQNWTEILMFFKSPLFFWKSNIPFETDT